MLLVAIGSVAAARSLMATAPMVVWDGDAAFDATPLQGIGPLGSLGLDVLTFLAASVSIWISSTHALGWRAWLPVAALPASAVLAWHGTHDFESLWRGAAWLSAVWGALALFLGAAGSTEIAQRIRTVVVATLLSIGAALLVRGMWQVTAEHAATIEYFGEYAEEFFTARGWEPDSPQAHAFERRLVANEAGGWYGLANLYGGVIGTIAVAMAGLLCAGWRHADTRVRAVALTLIGLAIALVAFNGGKAAIAATLIGLAMAAGSSSRPARGVRAWGAVRACIVAIPLLVGVVVAARFMAGPEALGAERSLLMRGFYQDGAWQVLMNHPLGVGASGFQQAFLQVAAETCPEDAASVHHAWGDWLVSAGWAGLGLVLVAACFLWKGTAPAGGAASADRPVEPVSEPAFVAAIAAGVIALVAIADSADPEGLTVAVVSIAACALLARMLAPWLCTTMCATGSWRIGAVATLALVTSLDMFHWHSGAASWCWILAGALAAEASIPEGAPTAASRTAMRGSALCAGALALSCLVVVPAVFQQERVLQSTAEDVARAADPHTPSGEMESLATARIRASTYLGEAFDALPTRRRIRELSIEQGLMGMVDIRFPHVADEVMMRIHQVASNTRADPHRTVAEARLLAETSQAMVARAGADPMGLVAAWEDVVAMSPRDARAWIRLGEARWRAGSSGGAVEAWREALRRDDLQSLDPVRQLPRRLRERVQQKIDASQVPDALRPS